ncbi:RnfH family protein [Luteimonas suaedae]|uniref:RnfH family protein n=1 Tax=Luteimonas suaedae TaxID=2605430 RepID=UPI003CCCC483
MAIEVEVIRAWPRRFEWVRVSLPEPATVADALAASGFDTRQCDGYAIHGERTTADAELRDGDRLELLRPLQADPKESRRRRAQRPR